MFCSCLLLRTLGNNFFEISIPSYINIFLLSGVLKRLFKKILTVIGNNSLINIKNCNDKSGKNIVNIYSLFLLTAFFENLHFIISYSILQLLSIATYIRVILLGIYFTKIWIFQVWQKYIYNKFEICKIKNNEDRSNFY